MKKIKVLQLGIAAILLLAAVFSSCSFDGAGNDMKPEQSFEIKVIDSCEYIYVSRRPYSGEFSLTHKGNCKFCTARHSR
jgi:hypothetical protein